MNCLVLKVNGLYNLKNILIISNAFQITRTIIQNNKRHKIATNLLAKIIIKVV